MNRISLPPQKLIEGHKQFLEEDFTKNRDLYEKLADEGQKPKVLWIGCCDSRVVPERILNTLPGDLFTVQNVGNIIPPFGMNKAPSVGAAIEFALNAIGVCHIIVCGHSDCGGVKAMRANAPGNKESALDTWIRYASSQMPDSERAEEVELDTAAKANVLRQLENIKTYPQTKSLIESDSVALHGFFYNLKSATLEIHNSDNNCWEKLSQ